jgi:hypothetical protein
MQPTRSSLFSGEIMTEYHLTYSGAEDRVLLSLNDHTQPVAHTRRLSRELLSGLASVMDRQKKARAAGANELVRKAVLQFEQSNAVSGALADGSLRRRKHSAPDTTLAKLATEVDITAVQNGQIGLTFKNRESLLTFSLDARGAHVLISTLFEAAKGADWDFPELECWVDPTAERPQGLSSMH